MIFELQGQLILDPHKPNIIFIDKGDVNDFTHIYGAARILKEKLKEQYNIITIGAGCKLENNYYAIQRQHTKQLLRKNEDTDSYIKNVNTMENWLSDSFKDLPVIDYIMLGTDDFFRLPLTSYESPSSSKFLNGMMNEYFDYIDEDETIIEHINSINKKVVDKWNQFVSPYAFSTQDYNLFCTAIEYINRVGKLKHKVVGFSIDPAIFTPYFELNDIPNSFYYFANDSRGTRNFKQLDIAQLQHLYNNKFNKPAFDDWDDEPVKKTKNLLFAGSIFQDKGPRSELWNKFLKDIQSDDCSFYIPLRKNGIIKKKDGRSERMESILKESKFKELYEDVISNKNTKGGIPPTVLAEEDQKYKYGMVFRCVSFNDSLNFKPVLYTFKNIVPFLDPMYDPKYQQIPKEIQDRLVVHSAKDIDEKIAFFNNNNGEREKVLQDLKCLFHVDDYINNPDKMIQEQIKKIIPEFNNL